MRTWIIVTSLALALAGLAAAQPWGDMPMQGAMPMESGAMPMDPTSMPMPSMPMDPSSMPMDAGSMPHDPAACHAMMV